jgi:hypothetical protein
LNQAAAARIGIGFGEKLGRIQVFCKRPTADIPGKSGIYTPYLFQPASKIDARGISKNSRYNRALRRAIESAKPN